MKTRPRTMALLAVGLASVSAWGQINFNFGADKPERSLDKVAEASLGNPIVVVAIGTNEEQLVRGQLRPIIEILKQVEIAHTEGDNYDNPLASLKLTTESMALRLSDLDPRQKRRLMR